MEAQVVLRRCCSHLVTKSSSVVTIYQIARLFGTAYLKVATARTAVNGFATTIIVPYNPGVFGEAGTICGD